MSRLKYGIIFLVCFMAGMCLPEPAEPVIKKGSKRLMEQDYQSIPKARFQEIFIRYLCNRLEKEETDITLSRFKVMGNRPVPAGEVSFRLIQKERRRLEGYVKLTVVISVDGLAGNRVKLYGWVDVLGSVLCTNRKIKKGEIIGEKDLYLSRKNISHLPPNIITDKSRVVGLMATRNIKAEIILKDWMFEKPPVVKRGDVVMILAESGKIKVTAPGLIMESGFHGELVRVKNTMSKKEIYGKVVNPSTVMVDF